MTLYVWLIFTYLGKSLNRICTKCIDFFCRVFGDNSRSYFRWKLNILSYSINISNSNLYSSLLKCHFMDFWVVSIWLSNAQNISNLRTCDLQDGQWKVTLEHFTITLLCQCQYREFRSHWKRDVIWRDWNFDSAINRPWSLKVPIIDMMCLLGLLWGWNSGTDALTNLVLPLCSLAFVTVTVSEKEKKHFRKQFELLFSLEDKPATLKRRCTRLMSICGCLWTSQEQWWRICDSGSLQNEYITNWRAHQPRHKQRYHSFTSGLGQHTPNAPCYQSIQPYRLSSRPGEDAAEFELAESIEIYPCPRACHVQ